MRIMMVHLPDDRKEAAEKITAEAYARVEQRTHLDQTIGEHWISVIEAAGYKLFKVNSR